MVLVLKDGTRWKLDPTLHQTKKLMATVDIENVMRFECIFTSKVNLEIEQSTNLLEIEKVLVPLEEQGLKSIDDCFSNLTKVTMVDSDSQLYQCKGCNIKAGMQKCTEIQKLSSYLALAVTDKLS